MQSAPLSKHVESKDPKSIKHRYGVLRSQSWPLIFDANEEDYLLDTDEEEVL